MSVCVCVLCDIHALRKLREQGKRDCVFAPRPKVWAPSSGARPFKVSPRGPSHLIFISSCQSTNKHQSLSLSIIILFIICTNEQFAQWGGAVQPRSSSLEACKACDCIISQLARPQKSIHVQHEGCIKSSRSRMRVSAPVCDCTVREHERTLPTCLG